MAQSSRLGRPKLQRSRKTTDVAKLQKGALDAIANGSGVLTSGQIAVFLQVSVKTVEDMMKSGELPTAYIGSDNLIKKFPRVLTTDLLIYLDRQSAL
jgi:hypothetical protein